MRNRWNARHINRADRLTQLVHRSRLLGAESALCLWGGGNTSTKGSATDHQGRRCRVLWMKGSGADLKSCAPSDFAPLRLDELLWLRRRAAMRDEHMVAYLERCLLDPKARRPSIETLLHAFVPEPDIDHTHADAILALTNTRRGPALVREVFHDALLWVPYVQPGFELSRLVAEAYQRRPTAHGVVLAKHGLITWGPDSHTSYERTIRYVTRAERVLAQARARRRSWSRPLHHTLPSDERQAVLERVLPAIRRTVSRHRRMLLTVTNTPSVLAFVNAAETPRVSQQGPATPDHMLRTRRLPLYLRARHPQALTAQQAVAQLERFASAHARYYRQYRQRGQPMLDPYPRVILWPGVGLVTTGKSLAEARMVAEIYQHDLWVMEQAQRLGGYVSVTAREAFGMEYWPLELYKLSLAPPEAELARMVGLVTGAAGGIGAAIALQLAERGAHVVVTDVDRARLQRVAAAINQRAGAGRALGVTMDVTRPASVARALHETLRTFGGLDFVVSNAGIAHVASVDRLSLADWERSMAVNATGHFLVARAAVRLLKAQGLGGTLVFIASKNVLAPGKEFAAYSAAKAAETQLARVLAIENGEHGIRVNIVNPDGVFEGSGLWAAIGPSRAKTYGVAPQRLAAYYRQRNLMRIPVLPEDVAEAVCFLVSQRAAKTTGCIVTVDGGLREAFPR